MKISQILDKVDDNQLFVPAFQREYVWKKDDAKELVASLIKEYPTGTMLTWETNNPPELKGKWKYKTNQGAVAFTNQIGIRWVKPQVSVDNWIGRWVDG